MERIGGHRRQLHLRFELRFAGREDAQPLIVQKRGLGVRRTDVAAADEKYFDSYSHFGIHREMLSDKVLRPMPTHQAQIAYLPGSKPNPWLCFAAMPNMLLAHNCCMKAVSLSSIKVSISSRCKIKFGTSMVSPFPKIWSGVEQLLLLVHKN